MIVGLAVCVGGSLLVASPALWFLGVLLLVGGTTLFSIASTWTVRSSWERTDWPDVSMPEEKRLRRLRRISILQCALASMMIGLSVWMLATGDFPQWWFYFLWGMLMLAIAMWTLRQLAKGNPAERQVDD